MHNIGAVFGKQWKETLKNKTVFIQFVLFPVMTLVMDRAVKIEGMPERFFVNLFAVMYIGMAPLTAMASILSEEKEKNTLRVLMMSDVKPHEYLIGIGGYVWLVCMFGAGVICAVGAYSLQEGVAFMGIMATGFLVSLLAGAAIGTWSRTEMMASSVAVPVMMIAAFAPMLSYFNTAVARIAKFVYTEQIGILLGRGGGMAPDAENICIIAGNMLVAALLFVAAYKRSRLA